MRSQGHVEFLGRTKILVFPKIADVVSTLANSDLRPGVPQRLRLLRAIEDGDVIAIAILRFRCPDFASVGRYRDSWIARMLVDVEELMIGQQRCGPYVVVGKVAAHHQWRAKNTP